MKYELITNNKSPFFLFLFYIKVAFPKYQERVQFADRDWNATHVSNQSLRYHELTEEQRSLEETRRAQFPFEVLAGIYDKHPLHTFNETRGRKKELLRKQT